MDIFHHFLKFCGPNNLLMNQANNSVVEVCVNETLIDSYAALNRSRSI